LPRLVELYEKYGEQGVKVVSINSGALPGGADQFLDDQNVRHLVLSDMSREVFEAYEVSGIPVTVIIDHEGRAMYRHLGYSPGDEERMAKEIETLISWREADQKKERDILL
jgi:peroxiredoxin